MIKKYVLGLMLIGACVTPTVTRPADSQVLNIAITAGVVALGYYVWTHLQTQDLTIAVPAEVQSEQDVSELENHVSEYKIEQKKVEQQSGPTCGYHALKNAINFLKDDDNFIESIEDDNFI